MFDAEGSGLEFIGDNALREGRIERDNPFLSKARCSQSSYHHETFTADVTLDTHRVAWSFDKTTEFKPDEIDGSMEAFHLCETVDLVEPVEDVGWRGVRIDAGIGAKKGRSNPLSLWRVAPCHWPWSRREALLWTHGDVKVISGRGSYFQGALSTPRPVRRVRHAGHGPWDDTARAALALSKTNLIRRCPL